MIAFVMVVLNVLRNRMLEVPIPDRDDSIETLFLDGSDESSSGGESHPSALTEPDVRLSPHPAPTIQPPA
jgi:hypothetical protein